MKISTISLSGLAIQCFMAFSMLLLGLQAKSQCTSVTVDLSSFPPDYVWSSQELRRNGRCCDATGSENCLRFTLTLNPNTVAVRFYSTSSPAYGSEWWSVNCGIHHDQRDSICLSGSGPHEIVYCKPAANADYYFIEAISAPTVPPFDSIRIGCSRELNVYGMVPETLSWNSITGTPGMYNNYLSDTGIWNPIFTPDSLAPAYIDYRVCGFPTASGCGHNIQYCDTMRIYVFPKLTAGTLPYSGTFFNTGPVGGVSITASANGGLGPYFYEWRDPSGDSVAIGETVFANTQGNYTLYVSDYFTRNTCGTANFTVYGVLQNGELFSLVESGAISGLTKVGVEQLYKEKNPTIYITDNSTNTRLYSQSAKKIVTDAQSIQLLENAYPLFSTVEMIEIKIKSANELSFVAQNSNWGHFQQLRFVHIQFEFQVCPVGQNTVQCEKQAVSDLFQQIFPNNIYLTYSISLTE